MDGRDEKQLRREAREQWEASRTAAARGDYRMVRQINERLVREFAASDVGESARRDLDQLKLDRLTLLVGLGSLLLYALAWGYALLSRAPTP